MNLGLIVTGAALCAAAVWLNATSMWRLWRASTQPETASSFSPKQNDRIIRLAAAGAVVSCPLLMLAAIIHVLD